MSLLHEALKKAEKEGRPGDSNRLVVDREEPGSGGSSLRVYILAAVAVTALLFFVTTRFLKKPGGISDSPTASGVLGSSETPLGIGSGPPAPELLERGGRFIEEKKWAEAKDAFEKAAILEPRNVDAYNNLGFVLRQLGEKDKAIEQVQKALSVAPDCAECLNNLGVLYLAERRTKEARGPFEKAVLLRADYADPHFHLALLAEAEGRMVDAKEHFGKYIELARGIDAAFLLKIQKRMASL